MAEELKTSEEWQEMFPSVRVIDPDGWDRLNFEYSWHQERISQEEFIQRRIQSTCMYPARYFE